MTTGLRSDNGSFRDPSGRVFHRDGRVFRTVNQVAKADYETLRDRQVFEKAIESGFLVGSQEVDPAAFFGTGEAPPYLLEHQRIPFVSYPYEWSFAALKAAALFHLAFHIYLLEQDVTLSDASAYNVQFLGPKPIFIDLLSLKPYRAGEYWFGHSQFCQQFLNPLLLRSRLGVAHNSWYRGNLEGIPTEDLAALLPRTSWLSWGVLSNVHLPAKLQKRAAGAKGTGGGGPVRRNGLPKPAFLGILRQLHRMISGLSPKASGPSTWGNYADANTYEPAEAAEKQRFVTEFVAKTRPKTVFDLGCNTGHYSETALAAGAERVIGFDFDQTALDRAFQRASERALQFTPLYLDAANQSPSQGWQQGERLGLQERARGDAVIALAFEHHLAIGRNVPLDQVVAWICRSAPTGIIEFVSKLDPTVQAMLRIRDDIFADYDHEHFERHLSACARIMAKRTVSADGRTLYWFETP